MATPATEARDQEAWLPPAELRPRRLYQLPVLRGYPAVLNVTEELLDRHVREGRGERPALAGDEPTLTYRELLAAASRLGNALRRLGVSEGEPVVLHALNEMQALVANLAILRLGAIVLPTSPMLSPAAFAHIANDARARVAIVSGVLAGTAAAARSDCPALEHVVSLAKAAELAAGESSELAPVRRPRSAVAVLFYSSGILEPAYAMAHLAEELLVIPDVFGQQGWGVRPDDVIASAGPLAFAGGYSSATTIPFRHGATSVAVPLDRSTPEALLELVRKHRVTLLSALPTGYQQMLEAAGDHGREDLRSLRVVAGGGEPLSPATAAGWREQLGHEIYEGFGTNGMFHVFITSAVTQRVKPGAIGVALPGYEVRAVTDSGAVARPGELGRLWARGPVGTLFWGPPERADAVAERQRATVRDGWILIGDYVTVDGEGYVTFVARAEDLIRRGGRAFGPRTVEAALGRHPAVAEAGVTGASGVLGGVRAHLVLAGGRAPGDAMRQEILEHCRRELAEAEVPTEIEFVAGLPRAPHGALLRRVLWERWFEQAGRAH